MRQHLRNTWNKNSYIPLCFTRTETLRDRDDARHLQSNEKLSTIKRRRKKTTHSDGGFAYEGAPVESLCSDDDFRWIHPLFSVHSRRQTPSSHLRVTVLWLWYMNLLSPNISRPDNNIFTAASSIYECVLFILEIYSHFLSKQFRLSRAAENTAMSKCYIFAF